MARQAVLVALVLLISYAALVYAADDKNKAPATAAAPSTSTGGAAASAPVDPNAIGNTDGSDDVAESPDDDVAVAGPVGSDSTYSMYPPVGGPTGGASALGVSAGFAAGAMIVSSFFFF